MHGHKGNQSFYLDAMVPSSGPCAHVQAFHKHGHLPNTNVCAFFHQMKTSDKTVTYIMVYIPEKIRYYELLNVHFLPHLTAHSFLKANDFR